MIQACVFFISDFLFSFSVPFAKVVIVLIWGLSSLLFLFFCVDQSQKICSTEEGSWFCLHVSCTSFNEEQWLNLSSKPRFMFTFDLVLTFSRISTELIRKFYKLEITYHSISFLATRRTAFITLFCIICFLDVCLFEDFIVSLYLVVANADHSEESSVLDRL